MKTILCVPGHDEKKVRECRKYGADQILFDLEDSVPEAKANEAHEIVSRYVRAGDAVRIRTHREFCLTQWPDGLTVWLPKLQTPWQANQVRQYINERTRSRYSFVLIVETPRALTSIVGGTLVGVGAGFPVSQGEHPKSGSVCGLAFGAADYAAYMNVPSHSPQIDYARQQVALAATALGIVAYDSPCTAILPELTIRDSEHARDLGYEWKGAVHPKQIDWVRSIGTGAWARRKDEDLVNWYERQGTAVALTVQGYIIAPPMIRAARKRLEIGK